MSCNTVATLEKIISLCKRRGFVFQSADIYGGLNGAYDFGPLGSLLKQNIRKQWQISMQKAHDEIVFIEGSILGPQAVWEASGHVGGFHDPMVDCLECKHRYRADHIDLNKACEHCGKKNWTQVRNFNLMFQTNLGAVSENASIAYLRPETAQAIFINFKNVMTTSRMKIPFGIAQMGKAFRNEITPKQFLFRTREFEQMEMEWFCKPESALKDFENWLKLRLEFYQNLGLNMDNIKLRPHDKDELAHYSTCCTDVEYQFPFGWKELEGIAYRGDFDLAQHSKHSGKELGVFDEETNSSFTPHVVETSVGIDRLFITLMFDAYCEDNIDGEIRTVLKFDPKIAPVKAAFFPLSKKLNDATYQIYQNVKNVFEVQFDDSGSIGKRYRRQDEIGTPFCFTYDFESETDNCVTVRDRNSTKQERISIDKIIDYIKAKCI
jgi:glycyl-tRNA synthetase